MDGELEMTNSDHLVFHVYRSDGTIRESRIYSNLADGVNMETELLYDNEEMFTPSNRFVLRNPVGAIHTVVFNTVYMEKETDMPYARQYIGFDWDRITFEEPIDLTVFPEDVRLIVNDLFTQVRSQKKPTL